MSTPAPGIAPAPTAQPSDRRARRLRWLALFLVLAVLAAIFLVPLINISRYHRTIAETLSRSLGRPVHLGSVQLQLLPHPGLAISDFIVEEDPRFGAEPLLRAPSVTVSLRLISLWRGRLEVSRIDLDEASLNLARNATGEWNFAGLLDQASHIPNAPTAQRHSSAAPRFPYIEVRNARINFKNGYEKKAFSFFNCDLSIWLDQPQQWRLRFEGLPGRTDLDLDLSDTGLLRVEGSLDRAASLDQMLVRLHAEWDRAAIGQVSRLALARDIGWRGDLRAEADISGDVRDLRLRARVRVSDVHRQEFTPLTPLDIDATCQAAYHHAARALDGLTCFWPIGSGHLLLTGDVENVSRPQTHLTLAINHTPASFALNLLELFRPGLPSSIAADGLMNGRFSWTNAAGTGASGKKETMAATNSRAFTGQVLVTPLSLTFPDASAPVALPPLRFATPSLAPARSPHHLTSRSTHAKRAAAGSPPSAPPLLQLDAAPIAMGAPTPLQLSGQFTDSGFDLRLSGSAALRQLLPWMRSFAILRSSLAPLASANRPQGSADLDLTLHGPWLAPTIPTISAAEDHPLPPTAAQGWLRLQRTQINLDWLPGPVNIESATAAFSPGKVTWSNAALTIDGIAVRGSATYPLPCDDPAGCAAHVNLDTAALDAAALESALLGTGRHGEFIDTLLAQVGHRTAPWPPLDAAAHVAALSIGPLVLHNVRTALTVHGRALQIDSLDAEALGGSLHASGSIASADFRPHYALDLSFSGVNIAEAAALFREKWGTGSIDGGTKLTLQGYSAADLASSARGTFHWSWTQGSLPLAAPEPASEAGVEAASLTRPGNAASPLHFAHWIATGTIGDSLLTLTPADGENSITGSIGFDRRLNLLWPGAKGQPIHIGGSLAHPTLEAAPRATSATPAP